MTKIMLILTLVLNLSCLKKDNTISPVQGPITEAIYGLGSVYADKTYNVQTGVSLRVRKIFTREGDHVKKGSPLIAFENGTIIKSPLDATIVHMNIKENELSTPQATLISLQDLTTLYIEVSLEQQSVMKVRVGQSVRMVFESLSGRVFNTQVKSVYPREQNFIVRFVFPEESTGVLPGMTADVAIEVGKKEKAWIIPVKAISQGHIEVDQGKGFKKTPVEIGVVDGTMAEIIKPEFNGSEKIRLE